MINIKIDGKKRVLKPCDDLTVREYSQIKSKTMGGLIAYLSVMLDVPEEEAASVTIKNITSFANRIGVLRDYTKIKKKNILIVDNNAYTMDEWSLSVGNRYKIEDNGNKYIENEEELLCYILAVKITNSMNDSEILEMKERLMDERYLDVLPTAFFLLTSLQNGEGKGTKLLARLIWWIAMNLSRFKQV